MQYRMKSTEATENEPSEELQEKETTESRTATSGNALGFTFEQERKRQERDADLKFSVDGMDEYDFGDITSMAHDQLEQHRLIRKYYRIMATEMPALAEFASEFKLPSASEYLRFKYTIHFGTKHPEADRVAVTFSLSDFAADQDLSSEAVHKAKLLLGTRYDSIDDTVKMTCNKFTSSEQNRAYLLDVIRNVAAEARKDPKKFQHVPFNEKHLRHKFEKIELAKARRYPSQWLKLNVE